MVPLCNSHATSIESVGMSWNILWMCWDLHTHGNEDQRKPIIFHHALKYRCSHKCCVNKVTPAVHIYGLYVNMVLTATLDYTWNLKCIFHPWNDDWTPDFEFSDFIQTYKLPKSPWINMVCANPVQPQMPPWVCSIICGNKWKTRQTLLLALYNHLTGNAVLGRGDGRICKGRGQNTQFKKHGQSCGLSQCVAKQWRRTRLRPP